MGFIIPATKDFIPKAFLGGYSSTIGYNSPVGGAVIFNVTSSDELGVYELKYNLPIKASGTLDYIRIKTPNGTQYVSASSDIYNSTSGSVAQDSMYVEIRSLGEIKLEIVNAATSIHFPTFSMVKISNL